MLKISKGKVKRAQRVVLYSIEGVGKSTFASHFPKPFFIDAEKGSHHLEVDRVEVTTWAEVQEAVKFVLEDKSYKTLVIDTADGIEDLLIKQMCKSDGVDGIEQVDGGFGKGYVKLAERWGVFLSTTLERVIEAGIHVVLLVHAQAKKFTEPGSVTGYDRFELLQSKQVAPLTRGWGDEVWFANYKTTLIEEKGKQTQVVGGKERLLHTSHTVAFDAKSRAGLGERIPMTYQAVAKVFEFDAKPEPKPEPKLEPAKEDEIPMDFDSDKEAVDTKAHPLDAVFQGKDIAKIEAFLLKRGEIATGETYRDVDDAYVARVLSNKESFLGAALK
jgi:hypothetical protein